VLWTAAPVCLAQQPVCVPGTPWCARTNADGSIQIGGSAQGQAGPGGANASASGNADANANAGGNANANADANAGGNANAGGTANAGGNASGYSSGSSDFGAGLALCGTLKAGVYSGLKVGPCFAISFRTESIGFEMESQLLFGGVRHSIDWVFPMSFIVPLTWESSLYEGLHLRFGGSPIGVTFAEAENGGNYLRFGLHAGLSYEWDVSDALSWRVFDGRAFLDFGTEREVDNRDNFIDFGGQLSTGIVF
jgi:hypothetical protein